MGSLLLIFILLTVYIVFTTNVTSILFIFCVLVLFTYIIPYYTLWDTFRGLGLIDPDFAEGFFFLIFLCLVSFFAGDRMGPSTGANSRMEPQKDINYKRFEVYSIITGCIGLAGYGYFIAASGASYYMGHQSGDFSVGGYIYELRYFIFSAVLLLFTLYLQKRLSKIGVYFLIFICCFLTWDAYIQQQRGSWIRFGIIFTFSYLFYKEGNNRLLFTTLLAKYKKIVIGAIFLGLLLIVTVQIRKFYTANGSLTDQLSSTIGAINDNPDVIVGGSGIDEGNEFVTAYNAYEARQKSGIYDYGKKWLYPFMNFIPRNLWAGKPNWETYSIDIFTYIDRYSKIRHAPGSAETGIIDSFYRFAWFAPFFFFLMGSYMKRLQVKSAYDLNTRFWYICVYIGCFYFFTQNMMPFVIFTLYMYIPIWFVNKTCTHVRRSVPYLFPASVTSA